MWLGRATVFFPLIGGAVGAVAAMVFLAGKVIWSESIAAPISFAFSVYLTVRAESCHFVSKEPDGVLRRAPFTKTVLLIVSTDLEAVGQSRTSCGCVRLYIAAQKNW